MEKLTDMELAIMTAIRDMGPDVGQPYLMACISSQSHKVRPILKGLHARGWIDQGGGGQNPNRIEILRYPPGLKRRPANKRAGMRRCLCCGEEFWSHGAGNRMCGCLEPEDAWHDGSEYRVALSA